MSALHRLDLFEEGSFSGALVVCLGTEEHACRQWCAEGCEEGCTGGRIILSGSAVELVAQAPLDGHRWEPIGSCREADWINAVGVEESHADGDGFPFDEDGDCQLGVRSGPVETEWTGDDYVWSYPEVPAVTDAGVPS